MIIRQAVTQTGADTATLAAIEGLPNISDGKTGMRFVRLGATWANAESTAAADSSLRFGICTDASVPDFGDSELIISGRVGIVAGAAGLVMPWSISLDEGRVSVQPDLYLFVSSAATAQANTVWFEIILETVRLSELEYLRLLAGGA